MSKELFIPMSSLQCAYMIERERGLKTTGTPCHVYMEFDTVSINETHLRKAWETLYVRHPMMRAKAEMCGLLKIEELNDREAERTIKIWEEDIFIKENMREILSHEKLDIRNGINCRLHLIKRHQKIVRLAFDLDLTMCDVLSFLIILRDLGEFYRYFKRGIIREYHSNEIEEEVLLSENRKSDKVYWEQRLRNSDIAFPLKVKGSIEELVKTKYISINRKMDKKVLDRLTLKLKISTEEILLIVFSYTVLKYTKKEQVLINFPFSNRTKERQNRVGDYTKSIIYRCDIKRGVAFTRFAGTPKEILGNEEMMNFFIPLLRADFEMDEKYLRKNKVKLECSINAFCGENDTEATETDMQEWGEYTSDFALEVFAGDHFFIKSNAKTVQSLNEIIKRNI